MGNVGAGLKPAPTTHPPFVSPIKGGIIFNSCSRRRQHKLRFRYCKIAIVARTLVRIGYKRTEVRATLKKLPTVACFVYKYIRDYTF